MSSQPLFCTHCGTRLVPGSAYCVSCGQRIAPAASDAYAPPPAPPPSAIYPPVAPSRAPTVERQRLSVGARLGMTVIGLLFLIFGLRGPFLQFVGASASGVVTRVTQERARGDIGYTYPVRYTFLTSEGVEHSGSTEFYNVPVTTLPRTGSTITVYYLPAWPALNMPAHEADLTILPIVLIVLGFGLTVLAWVQQ